MDMGDWFAGFCAGVSVGFGISSWVHGKIIDRYRGMVESLQGMMQVYHGILVNCILPQMMENDGEGDEQDNADWWKQ